MGHWHYGHNVSGYLPESPIGSEDDWADARAGLLGDIGYEIDSLDYAPEDDRAFNLYESLQQAETEIEEAPEGQDFLVYTDDGGAHTIPTAWWIEYAADTSGCEDDE